MLPFVILYFTFGFIFSLWLGANIFFEDGFDIIRHEGFVPIMIGWPVYIFIFIMTWIVYCLFPDEVS